MEIKGYRKGVALVTALVLTGVSTIVLGGVIGYVSHASRMAGYYEGKNACRLAAQSEIEVAKAAIHHQFEYSLNRTARIVAAGSTAPGSYDWFDAYSGAKPKRNIGKVVGGKDATLTLANVVTNNGCLVKVRIGRVDHPTGAQWANVTLVAEATRSGRGGAVAKTIIEETIRFSQQRSKVFDNAYFVNNYGWFESSVAGTTWANGDVRANGDFYLDDNVTINGHIYAARNDELRVPGSINNWGQMEKRTTYINGVYSTTSTTTGGAKNRARPLEKDPTAGIFNKGGYAAPDTVTSADRQKRIHPNQEFAVEMPYIGEICYEESDYRQWIDELRQGSTDKTICTVSVGSKQKIDKFFDGTGPSGKANAADKGAIVLIGTDKNNPIKINGPVIVASDVIIGGYVTGQGTIYSGRNIHIVDDIKYVNPPSWSNKSSSGAKNNEKDMLGLMAKGNIVLGDYTVTDSKGRPWSGGNYSALTTKPYVQEYACDTSDANIGYPATFGGSYVATEKVPASQLTETAIAAAPGGCELVGANYQFGKFHKSGYVATATEKVSRKGTYQTYDLTTGNITQQYFQKGEERITACEQRLNYNTYDRKYFETVCDDSEITSRAKTLSQIDAILYNNHAVMGRVGNCSFNGSLVCRNEAIVFGSGNYASNHKLYLNWDSRLYSGSSETVDNDKVGLAKGSDNPPEVIDWRELPEGVVAID